MDGHAPRKPETTLLTKTFEVERKTFTVALCENDKGKFVKLIESKNGRTNSIIIPETGVGLIAAHLEELSNHCAVPPGT